MSWEEYQGRKAELKAAIQRDRDACRDTDLAGASRSLEVRAHLLLLRCFSRSTRTSELLPCLYHVVLFVDCN